MLLSFLRNVKSFQLNKTVSPCYNATAYLSSCIVQKDDPSTKWKKRTSKHGRKLRLLLDATYNVCDKFLLFKNLLNKNTPTTEKFLHGEDLYKYLLHEYQHWLHFMSISDIIESIKILVEIDERFDHGKCYIKENELNRNIVNTSKEQEYPFKDKPLSFHKREIAGTICNVFVQTIHDISGPELVRFIVYFFKWKGNTENQYVFFYNFYFNHVFRNLYLFNEEVYKILFIFNSYIHSNGLPFTKNGLQALRMRTGHFTSLGKKEDAYFMVPKKEYVFKESFSLIYNNLCKLSEDTLLNILKLYVGNQLNTSIYMKKEIFEKVSNNLPQKSVEYHVKFLNICNNILKQEERNLVNEEKDQLILKYVKLVIYSLCALLNKNMDKPKCITDIESSVFLNCLHNKKILEVIKQEDYFSHFFFDTFLRFLDSIKFTTLHSISISFISIKHIIHTLLKKDHKTRNHTTLVRNTMYYGLKLSNAFIKKCIQHENKSTLFHSLKNVDAFHFKVKPNDLVSIKVISNTFTKLVDLQKCSEYYELFNNIACLLYYFFVNEPQLNRFKDIHIYLLCDLSSIYKRIKTENTLYKEESISRYNMEILLYNMLQVSSWYIKHSRNTCFSSKEEYVCLLIFLNYIFVDTTVSFDSIHILWMHINNAFEYFKEHKLIHADIISLLLLSCSKFQYYLENAQLYHVTQKEEDKEDKTIIESRYSRRELRQIHCGMMEELINHYVPNCADISLDNLSKILISLANSKYVIKINEAWLLQNLKGEQSTLAFVNTRGMKQKKDFDNEKFTVPIKNFQRKNENFFVHMTKIIESLLKLDIFFYLKHQSVYIQLLENAFCYIPLQPNVIKRLLFLANTLYLHPLYSLVCEIMVKSLQGNMPVSYDIEQTMKNRIFKSIAEYLSDDDYIEITNTLFVLFYDYIPEIQKECYQPKKYFCKGSLHARPHDMIHKKDAMNWLQLITHLLNFLKMNQHKLLFFQMYLNLCNTKKFTKKMGSSMFHSEVLGIIQNLNFIKINN